jgi:hypothetical protein
MPQPMRQREGGVMDGMAWPIVVLLLAVAFVLVCLGIMILRT